MRKEGWTPSKQKRKKCQPQHDVEVPFARMITDITSMSPWTRKNSGMPIVSSE
jgi:hypothetical protein